MIQRNVFVYWEGHEYFLVKVLRKLIRMHSNNGTGYTFNLITPENLMDYVDELPNNFDLLVPAHRADYIRLAVVSKFGGIWLDSDTLVIESLDKVFDKLENKDGFFIRENNEYLWNGIFGAKAGSPLIEHLREKVFTRIEETSSLQWTEIGNQLYQRTLEERPDLFEHYDIWQGLDTVYPINWDRCAAVYLAMPGEEHSFTDRTFQPFIVLVNSVYQACRHDNIKDLLGSNTLLAYYLNKSFDNIHASYADYDFVEIGTSNFDTLLQSSTNETGLSVEALKYYLDSLPDRPNVKKINYAIGETFGVMDMYYVPEHVIEERGLPWWLKGCNSVGNYHMLHVQYGIQQYVKIDKVNVVTIGYLFHEQKVGSLAYLKIDTEGHDIPILRSMIEHLKFMSSKFYPKRILFETNENTSDIDVDVILHDLHKIGYTLESRGYDTTVIYGNN